VPDATGMPIENAAGENHMEAMPLFAALAAGLTGSLHCALMCGPLACIGGGGKAGPALAWHAGRTLSYSALGALLGGAGAAALTGYSATLKPWLPLVMAIGLAITALDLGKRWKAPAALAQMTRGVAAASAKFSPPARALSLGLITPLLPCGLLWGMALASAAAGGALAGAAVLGTFALGSAPALLLAQAQARLWPTGGRWAAPLRRGVVLLAAAVIVWRALSVDASAATEAAAPPHCH
jgi:uncharacterized protein